jgi:hypothetical protein
VDDSAEFWDELTSISPRTAKVVAAYKKYAAVMEKAGVPYRYSQGFHLSEPLIKALQSAPFF